MSTGEADTAVGAGIACRTSPRRGRPGRRSRRLAEHAARGGQERQCGGEVRAPSCLCMPEEHRSERGPPRAWTRPEPCRSTDHETGAKWEPREARQGLAQAAGPLVEQYEPLMSEVLDGAASTSGFSLCS